MVAMKGVARKKPNEADLFLFCHRHSKILKAYAVASRSVEESAKALNVGSPGLMAAWPSLG